VKSTTRLFILGGLLLTIALALFVSPFASNKPDGLNKVAIDQGFDDTARDHPLSQSPVAGYGISVVDDARVSRGLSGLIGVLVTFGAGLLLFAALRRARTKPAGHTQER
jgi:cobalt/nickel transport system permease protein